jgi:histone H3/H4
MRTCTFFSSLNFVIARLLVSLPHFPLPPSFLPKHQGKNRCGMQTPHLSCPSSSTTVHASSYVTHFIHSLLTSAGFTKSSSQAVQLLTEVFERYLLLLASTSKHYSNHVGRRTGLVHDVERSLNDLGSSTEEIQRWFEEEGGDIAGKWLEVGHEDGALYDLDLPNSGQLKGKCLRSVDGDDCTI